MIYNQKLHSSRSSFSKSNLYKQPLRESNHFKNNKQSGFKNQPRDQQSSDYIRNLYKKYLGKQNIDSYTERKLKTTDIKDNQQFKDLKNTKKALFQNDTHIKKTSRITSIIQTIPSDNDYQYNIKNISTSRKLQKSTSKKVQSHNSIKNIQTPKRLTNQSKLKDKQNCKQFYKDKRFDSKNQKRIDSKNQKRIDSKNKMFDSKNDKRQFDRNDRSQTKSINSINYTSRPKRKQSIHKNGQQLQNQVTPMTFLKKSQSTQLRKQKSIQKKQKNVITQINNESGVYLNRNLYCQFNTDQQAKNRIKTGNIYETFINDLQTLNCILGPQAENNLIYQTLKKINIAKKKIMK